MAFHFRAHHLIAGSDQLYQRRGYVRFILLAELIYRRIDIFLENIGLLSMDLSHNRWQFFNDNGSALLNSVHASIAKMLQQHPVLYILSDGLEQFKGQIFDLGFVGCKTVEKFVTDHAKVVLDELWNNSSDVYEDCQGVWCHLYVRVIYLLA